MKKLWGFLLVMLFLLGSFSSSAFAQEEREVLVLVYLCGTDLETDSGAASYDLLEMLEAGLTLEGPVTVLVQAGGTKEWQSGILESGESQRFVVADDLYPIEDSLGKLDMGAPDTLRDFVRFGLETYPAKRVGLVLWDHGAGATGGVCYDEMTGNSLNAGELHGALSQALDGGKKRLAFIGFDACLMSTFEVATYLKPFADFMVASEELEPGSGWAYDQWLGTLTKEPTMDTVAIGRSIVDSFIEGALSEDPNDYVTLAVTDLQQMETLVQAVESFGHILSEALQAGEFPVISRARAQMRAFGDFVDASSDMVDIAEAAWYCRNIAPEASSALASAVKGAVLYSRNSANIQSAGGLSILLPEKTKAISEEYVSTYDTLSLMPGYSDFVETYVAQLTKGSHEFGSATIQTFSLNTDDEETPVWLSGLFQEITQSSPELGNWLDTLQDDGDGEQSESDVYEQAFEAYGDEVYALQLSQEDLAGLSHVEASLLQDAQDQVDAAYGDEVYFDYGLLSDVYVDWENGAIYGLFDGSWPTLEGQMVAMYDQVVSEDYTRSLIPALVNDEEQYLLVVFNDTNPYGMVVGYSEGYDSNGNPVRGYVKLNEGDVVVPLYDLIYWDNDDEMQTESFSGDDIIVGKDSLEFGYEDVEAGTYSYAFCLNDVYGGYQFSEFYELVYE